LKDRANDLLSWVPAPGAIGSGATQVFGAVLHPSTTRFGAVIPKAKVFQF
jgi:hypothetical protein